MIEEKIAGLTQAVEANTAALLVLAKAVAAFAGNAPTPASAAPPADTEKRGRGRPPKTEAAPAAETEGQASVPTVTRADVSKAAQQMLDAGRIDELRDFYKKLGFEKLSEAAAERYPEILAGLQKLLAKSAETPAPESAPKDTPAPAAAKTTVTLDEIKALAVKLRDTGNSAKLKEINASFKVAKISEVALDKYPEVHAALTKAVADLDSGDV